MNVLLSGASRLHSSTCRRARGRLAATWARPMVVGACSASFEMLHALVKRPPAMICPRWIDTRTQPVAISDVIASPAALSDRPDVPAAVQLGGADAGIDDHPLGFEDAARAAPAGG